MKKYSWYNIHEKFISKRKMKFVNWFYKIQSTKYCWADCVAWALASGRFNPFAISKGNACKLESLTHSTDACYCGCWHKGRCWDTLTVLEKEAHRTCSETTDGVPF